MVFGCQVGRLHDTVLDLVLPVALNGLTADVGVVVELAGRGWGNLTQLVLLVCCICA